MFMHSQFLFHLPLSIERNIQKGDYGVVINDYEKAKSLFSDTDVNVFKKGNPAMFNLCRTTVDWLLCLKISKSGPSVKKYVKIAPRHWWWRCLPRLHRCMSLLSKIKSNVVAQVNQGLVQPETKRGQPLLPEIWFASRNGVTCGLWLAFLEYCIVWQWSGISRTRENPGHCCFARYDQ